jgi:hypothetical protein
MAVLGSNLGAASRGGGVFVELSPMRIKRHAEEPLYSTDTNTKGIYKKFGR